MNTGEALRAAARRLAGVTDAPAFEARLLIERVTGRSRFLPDNGTELAPGMLAELCSLLERRLSYEPLQYILGEWSFMGLDFTVNEYALIPRQDTETLAEAALDIAAKEGFNTALDICTGTGCVAVALKKLGSFDTVAASDISYECAALAAINAERNGVEIDISVRDLLKGHGRYDIITANPPYISDGDMELLQEEVKREPRLALAGGEDGLSFYRRIAEDWRGHINPGGVLLMEVGAGQADEVAAMFSGFETRKIADLCGIERVVTVKNAK